MRSAFLLSTALSIAGVAYPAVADDMLVCNVSSTITCDKQVCKSEPAGDEPLTFIFNFKRRTISAQEGEGSRGGKISFRQDSGSYSIAAEVGPVNQGNRLLGDANDSDVAAIIVSKKSKTFQAVYASAFYTGECD